MIHSLVNKFQNQQTFKDQPRNTATASKLKVMHMLLLSQNEKNILNTC